MLRRTRDQRRLIQEEHTFSINGREWSWIASTFPLLDDDGSPYALAALATDVTDLKGAEREVRALNRELEARVASRTRELEMANRDLATFSYTVAHDLRAPLRTIHGFSSILLEEHGQGLSDDGLRYLRLVEQGATEMAQLIEDLLTFARTGQGDLERRTVPTGEVVRDALHDLQGDEPSAPEQVRIAPDLPDCYADPRLLRVVFQNLLGNALKFTRAVEERRIEVGAEEIGGETAFFVRDNGAGFPSDRADRLFQMFQRLHSTDEFEGTGLGLAIVERIVHRHGGRAWAEGAVGEGATIHFTLGSEDAVRRS
jgi:light-regulated signal transduction histidine kinase (bacteriophytochrome)